MFLIGYFLCDICLLSIQTLTSPLYFQTKNINTIKHETDPK